MPRCRTCGPGTSAYGQLGQRSAPRARIRARDKRARWKFGYRIVGKRRDVEVERFAYAAGVPGLPGVPTTVRD